MTKRENHSVFNDEFYFYLEDKLFEAVQNNDLQKLKEIRNCININSPNKNGMTPLMIASREGFLEIVKYLLKCGSSLTCRDKEGKTALIHARENEHTEIEKLLERETLHFYKDKTKYEEKGFRCWSGYGYRYLYEEAKEEYMKKYGVEI